MVLRVRCEGHACPPHGFALGAPFGQLLFRQVLGSAEQALLQDEGFHLVLLRALMSDTSHTHLLECH